MYIIIINGGIMNKKIVQSIIACKFLVKNGKLSCQSITDKFNEGKEKNFHIVSRVLINRMRKMGIEIITIHGGGAAIYWDENVINRLVDIASKDDI
jgi:hypothetical protein